MSNTDEAKATMDEIVQAGGNAIICKANMASVKDQKNLLHETIDKFGEIDILVNNAGIAIRKTFFECS